MPSSTKIEQVFDDGAAAVRLAGAISDIAPELTARKLAMILALVWAVVEIRWPPVDVG